MRHSTPLGALEACGNILSAVIEQQAQRDRDIKIDAQNIGLMVVQRQTVASTSVSPWMRLQQGIFGGVPTTRYTKSFNRLAHTPSLRVSLGQAVGLGAAGSGVALPESVFVTPPNR
jgi:hypothetical protein